MSVLILTLPGDLHAHAVRWAIEKLGGSASIVYPADLCDGARWSFDPRLSHLTIEYRSEREELDLNDFRTVWMRRAPSTFPQSHITDEVERAITEDDFGTLALSMYQVMERGRFAVNPSASTRVASLKPLQLSVAAELGFNLPRSVISNSPEVIREFFADCCGKVVFKPFASPIWQTDRGPTMVPTSRLTHELLDSADLAAAPGIFQEELHKKSEVRATVMGRSIFAWEKWFERRGGIDVDWSFVLRGAKHRLHILPTKVAETCFEMMDRLGLVFGCFDFVLDESGQYFFLEVNVQGQWLWGDTICNDLNQLEGMAEFLLSADPQFRYSGRNSLSIADYRSARGQHKPVFDDEHRFGNLMTFMYYQSSFPMNSALRPKS